MYSAAVVSPRSRVVDELLDDGGRIADGLACLVDVEVAYVLRPVRVPLRVIRPKVDVPEPLLVHALLALLLLCLEVAEAAERADVELVGGGILLAASVLQLGLWHDVAVCGKLRLRPFDRLLVQVEKVVARPVVGREGGRGGRRWRRRRGGRDEGGVAGIGSVGGRRGRGASGGEGGTEGGAEGRGREGDSKRQ